MKKLHLAEKYTGSGSILHIAEIMRNEGVRKVMIVTDDNVYENGMTFSFEEQLVSYDIEFTHFTEINGKADLECIEKGTELFL
ncbi:MAG: iron-containing alcohol dehydrogenase, partial [Oscillospiraceae bacterium]|nr:iron-containing alcohol dehydrogenase [Oscillospiraceae bacterium]